MGNKVLYTKHLSPEPGNHPASQDSSSEYPQVMVYFAESLFLLGFCKPWCSSEFRVAPNIQSPAMEHSFFAKEGEGAGQEEFGYLGPPGLQGFRKATEELGMLGRWVFLRHRQLTGTGIT